MKETIKINLSGQLFDLDNDAYECLKKYLDSLSARFKSSPSEAAEILEDIEARISEILQEKLGSAKQVVTLADIEEIISLMGSPDEMEDSEEEEKTTSESTNTQFSYSKRLFRDTHNRIIGGVCSGLGTYLGIDPVWIRILFVFLFFAKFSGVLIYVVLWIVLTPARTTSDRMRMQGKPFNINDIEDSVKTEFEKVKTSVKNIPKSKGYQNAEGSISEFFQILGNILLVIIKVIAAIVIVTLIVSLILGFLGLFVGNFHFPPFRFLHHWNWHWPGPIHLPEIGFMGICIFLLIAIPILGLVGKIFRSIFNINSTNRIGSGIAATVWSLAFISLIVILVMESDKDFLRESESSRRSFNIEKSKPLYLDLSSTNIDDDELKHYQIIKYKFSYHDRKDEFLKRPTLSITSSHSDESYLVLERSYLHFHIGVVPKQANKMVEYEWQKHDTLLQLDEYYICDDDDAWRLPRLNITLKIPEGQMVNLDDDLIDMMDKDLDPDRLYIMKKGHLEPHVN